MVDSNTSGTGSGGTESSLVGGLGGATPPSGGKKRVLNALRVGARVNLEGMRAVVTETTSWLRVLRDVRKELDGINTAAARFPASMGAVSGGGGGGVGASPGVPSPNNLAPYARMQSMTKGFVAITATRAVFSYGTDRFNRNLTESVPLSQHDTLLTSMYSGKSGYQYGTVDRQRLIALGQFGMSRGEAAAAQGIGLGYGQNPTQTNTFLSRTVAPVVQASGGTLTPSGAAQVSAQFLDPLTLRRAQSLNIPMGRIGGQVGNPYTVAQGYIKDFEKRNGNKLNGIDYTNMRSAGSMVRFEMKRMYQLTDEAIDTIIQAGMQNITFQSMPGNGNKNIDFSSSRDLAQVVPTNRLGLTAFKALTASATREANFASKRACSSVVGWASCGSAISA